MALSQIKIVDAVSENDGRRRRRDIGPHERVVRVEVGDQPRENDVDIKLAPPSTEHGDVVEIDSEKGR